MGQLLHEAKEDTKVGGHGVAPPPPARLAACHAHTLNTHAQPHPMAQVAQLEAAVLELLRGRRSLDHHVSALRMLRSTFVATGQPTDFGEILKELGAEAAAQDRCDAGRGDFTLPLAARLAAPAAYLLHLVVRSPDSPPHSAGPRPPPAIDQSSQAITNTTRRARSYDPATDAAYLAFVEGVRGGGGGDEGGGADEQVDEDVVIEGGANRLAPNSRCPITSKPVRGGLGRRGRPAGWLGGQCVGGRASHP